MPFIPAPIRRWNNQHSRNKRTVYSLLETQPDSVIDSETICAAIAVLKWATQQGKIKSKCFMCRQGDTLKMERLPGKRAKWYHNRNGKRMVCKAPPFVLAPAMSSMTDDQVDQLITDIANQP